MQRFLSILLIVSLTSVLAADHHEEKQYFELRQYQLKSKADAEVVDAYLSQALVPALKRLGAGPIGLFREESDADQPSRFLLIPHSKLADLGTIHQKLASDGAYQEAASAYLALSPKEAPLLRIRSELLHAFDCLPQLTLPEISKAKRPRVFELRIYESPTERLGDLKVEMFNSGEVEIFLDCGITPVFFGQARVGHHTPNLTYMTVYPNREAQEAAWAKFRAHPDWKKLSAVAKYRGTVSDIQKFQLSAMPGSDL